MAEPRASARRTYIAQGEQAVGDRDDDVISTILGSCVAVCLWWPEGRVGGMNHILLPDGGGWDMGARGVGATAMETLVNALMKRGVTRGDLKAKVFGGGAIVDGLSDIGARNTRFVFEYLQKEGIPCLSQSVGGRKPRQVRFWPATGRAQQRFVRATDVGEERPVARPSANDPEIF